MKFSQPPNSDEVGTGVNSPPAIISNLNSTAKVS